MLAPIANTLEHFMTLLSARQKVVASNIANADTPGYKTQDIDFQTELANVNTGLSPTPSTVPGLKTKNDGNNVNLDRESRLLAEDALRFSMASNLVRSQIKIVRMAIEGGNTSS